MSRHPPHAFTLRQLQYALSVAELRSFSRAAEACAVAQPSLSAQVAHLEASLGVRIFERLPRGVAVTAAGAELLERMRRTLREADDLVATSERARDPLAGTLRVGVIPTIAPYLLPEVAPAVRKRLPRMLVTWVEEKTRLLVAAIRAGEFDAGILAAGDDLAGLAQLSLGRDPFLLATPPGHPLARARSLRVDTLEGETVLLLDDGHCFRDQALEICQRAGADESSVRATSLSTLAQMVAGGVGVTLLPSIAVSTENRARGLVVRPFGARGPSRTLVLAWRTTSPLETALRALSEPLRAGVERLTARCE